MMKYLVVRCDAKRLLETSQDLAQLVERVVLNGLRWIRKYIYIKYISDMTQIVKIKIIYLRKIDKSKLHDMHGCGRSIARQ